MFILKCNKINASPIPKKTIKSQAVIVRNDMSKIKYSGHIEMSCQHN